MPDDNIFPDLIKGIQKALKDDSGEFVTQFGKERKFPEPIASLSSDNILFLKELYKYTYELSLNNFLSTHARSGVNAFDLFKAYLAVVEFIFGNEKHYGAYSTLLDLYQQKRQPITNAVEIIIAAESMYVLNYKIRSTEDGYMLFSPSMEVINKVPEPEENKIKSYNYMDALVKFFEKSDPYKKSAITFEIASDSEKLAFPVPANHKNLIITIEDLIKEDDYKFELLKKTDDHYGAIFSGRDFNISNVSFIGTVNRNYHFLPWSYANTRIVKDLYDTHGFIFVNPTPVKFVADYNGYLVSKVSYINNDITQAAFSSIPEPMTKVTSWHKAVSNQGKVALTKELATYILTQLAIGYSELSTDFFFLDEDTREIVHFTEKNPTLLKMEEYQSAPNNLTKLDLELSGSFILDIKKVYEIAQNLYKNGQLKDTTEAILFGEVSINLSKNAILQNADPFNFNNLPKDLFLYEHGVFASVGKDLIEGKIFMYNDWFSEHIKKSGMSLESNLTYKIMNRFTLFSVLSYLFTK